MCIERLDLVSKFDVFLIKRRVSKRIVACVFADCAAYATGKIFECTRMPPPPSTAGWWKSRLFDPRLERLLVFK